MIAYLDCFAGISGDMSLGALVDLGVPVEWLQSELEEMPLSDFALHSRRGYCSGIKTQNVSVRASGGQPFRPFELICQLINQSPLSSQVKSKSLTVLNCLAEAKSRLYGCKKETVHFEEEGGERAIIEVVGTVLGLEYMGIDTLLASRLPVGSESIQIKEGGMPGPAPETLEILNGWPVRGGGNGYDFTTPIGAAIVAALSIYNSSIPEFTIQGVGYGTGKHDSAGNPNLMRIIIGKAADYEVAGTAEDVMVVETNIDDMNPEIFGYLMERLFEDGALDVVWMPVFMKKNRPGTKLEVLCRIAEKEKIVQRILKETTSIGVRFYEVRRNTLGRRKVEIDSPWGVIRAKEITDLSGEKRIVPEYDVCRRIAKENDLSLRHVYEIFYRKT